ncbi:hypothetical protein OG884_11845 [Streptosporangium sp. NBC_01755]|uniref:hypothetical protein n=1 Tax=unclassified Streptosporangium TaxID=2632669 RepID=UPI002DD9C484|nr:MULTISPECIES: hypothetical protein [unclassified Streptosporangium]WSA26020.1 hypothetical protein OIE13_34865 [Streptosporangium sp. NBC_01810]WSD02558.1 hypothetical protein OG884_11845 [Streptosporangium sp. NBC_01755]
MPKPGSVSLSHAMQSATRPSDKVVAWLSAELKCSHAEAQLRSVSTTSGRLSSSTVSSVRRASHLASTVHR